MEGYTLKQLKWFKFEVIKDMFDKAFKRVYHFVDSINREEVAIDAFPLATKTSKHVDAKIVKKAKDSLFQIIRANGCSKGYSSMIQMLKDFDREDLETLWKLVKAKHGSTRPEEGYARVLWGDLMTMFKPDVESPVWRTLQNEKVLIWKLFDSCGVHFLRLKSMHLFILVEKRYPLTPATITKMLNKKLQIDHLNEMCYQLLKLMTKQLKKQIKSFIRLFGIIAALIKVSDAQEERRVFNNEVEQLSNEYILRIGKKGYVLDDVWEKYEQNHRRTTYAWHDEGRKEEELWKSGIEKTKFEPPMVNVETFKLKRYSFKEGNVLSALPKNLMTLYL
ncbi:hypothetical protein Tco_0924303 [Tanacetum coccineum]|uniref:Uncharacterized protein n=1 Tax=Tanacetum coccineum TaxID=301880 RepID=A0ABQ5D9T7_9ASTR